MPDQLSYPGRAPALRPDGTAAPGVKCHCPQCGAIDQVCPAAKEDATTDVVKKIRALDDAAYDVPDYALEAVDEIERLRAHLADAERTLADWRTCCETARRERDKWKAGYHEVVRERLRDAIAARMELRRCGNCADWQEHPYRLCNSTTSMCREREEWPADHGCPHFRTKEDSRG
jgi:hypothetical protein